MANKQTKKALDISSKKQVTQMDSLVTQAKGKGFVTYAEINKALPENGKLTTDDLEQAISRFSEAGIDILEEDDEDIKLDISVDEEVVFSPIAQEQENEEEEEDENLGTT